MDPHFFPPFFSLEHVVYTLCSYIRKHSSHWIPFSCLPLSVLNQSQSSPARITGWCSCQCVGNSTSAVRVTNSLLNMPFLELPANSHSFCLVSPSFPLHLQFLCSFPFSRQLILIAFAHQASVTPSSAQRRPIFSHTGAFLPTGVPATSQFSLLGLVPSHHSEEFTQSHHWKLFFYTFCLPTRLYWVIPWERHKFFIDSLWVLGKLEHTQQWPQIEILHLWHQQISLSSVNSIIFKKAYDDFANSSGYSQGWPQAHSVENWQLRY